MEYSLEKTHRRECLECGTMIHYGRSDKKFCSDACKNKYHNRESKRFLQVHSKVIHILDKNYRILSHCLSKGLTAVDLGDIIQWGFNPDYVTGIRRTRMRLENRCYDIKDLRTDSRLFNIERIPFTPDEK